MGMGPRHFFEKKKIFFKVNSVPNVGLNSQPQDEELHALPSELSKCPQSLSFSLLLCGLCWKVVVGTSKCPCPLSLLGIILL